MKHAWLIVGMACIFVGCAATVQDRYELETLSEKNVPSDLYDRILHEQAISYDDVKVLTAHQVPDKYIIRAIYASDAIYRLNSKSIADLKRAHVSDAVIDAMLKTKDRYYDEVIEQESYWNPGYGYYPYPYPYYYPGPLYFGFHCYHHR